MEMNSNLRNILKKKKVFIFDLDGTLIDSVGIWNDVDKELIEKLTGNNANSEQIKNDRDNIIGSSKNKNPYIDYIHFLRDKYHIKLSFEELFSYREKYTIEYLTHVISLKPGAKELIDLLYQNGHTLVLATTTNRRCVNYYKNINANTKILNFDQVFSLVLTMEDITNFKPNPEIYLQALNILDVDADEAIVIEDSVVGCMAAKNALLDVIVVYDENYKDKREFLENNATIYIENLAEITKNYPENGQKLEKINKID